MKNLIKYNLDYEKAVVFFKDHLLGGNTLSKELLNAVNFENGHFFTLLPNDANLAEILNFSSGWVLPQNEINERLNKSGDKIYFSRTPTLIEEISAFVLNKLNHEQSVACIFEDVLRRPNGPHLEFFHQYGLLYLSELYYFLDKKNASLKTIMAAIGKADALWHLVFILTKIDNQNALDKEITFNDIKQFCQKIQLLVVGAYDGEGYVLWEPNIPD